MGCIHSVGGETEAVRFTQRPLVTKTRMLGLSDGERISMIRLAVLIRYTRVTDRRTDGIGVAYTRCSIYAVARKNYNGGSSSNNTAEKYKLYE